MDGGGRDCVDLGARLDGLGLLVAAGQSLEEVLLVLGQAQPQEDLQLGLDRPPRLTSSLLARQLTQ